MPLMPAAPWPDEGLENLLRCPVCGDAGRDLLHDGLRDLLFGAAGKWRLFRCTRCGLAYLDPRPDPLSIGAAYQRYYTHAERQLDDDPAAPAASLVADLKQRLLRHYLVYRFGPVGKGRWLLALPVLAQPRTREAFDMAMRNLPRPQDLGTLLDIGCGSGRFMAWARLAGWTCTGAELDPVAAAQAAAKGFEVHVGDAQGLSMTGRTFRAVTLSHVIEHVHDPRRLLKVAFRLLETGGHFWIETPNVDARGHQVFGRSWRGLEPPRHLQLFHPELLERLLKEAGFTQVRTLPHPGVWPAIEEASLRIGAAEGKMPASFTIGADAVAQQDPLRREFITMTATK
jgi:SAM-dependent methyltransferase